MVEALAHIQRFARAMSSNVPAVESAWPDLRALLEATGRPFRVVGGLAVIHHGYVRATSDLDVLVDGREGDDALDPLLEAHGFVRLSPTRLRHHSGVTVDLLIAGSPSPRPGEPPYPAPSTLAASERDPAIVGLLGLVTLKISARRAQDRADLVALLKQRSEAEYLTLEAGLPAARRSALYDLWREAQEELAMEAAGSVSP